MKARDVLHLTRAASPQFVRPTFLRLIKVRTELHTYAGWIWLDGYQLDERDEAVARRELYVLEAAVRLLRTPRSNSGHGTRRTEKSTSSEPRSRR
ncbi:hypothetical protein [Micromonospora haikouensis]|uniref:hypothetical protein n=1 Tax=Micromonospora haikouensis TaxID=686309 RepID=UPI0005C6C94B|nr:hypothetical protein [Micromonospora haikouensis]